MKLMITHAAYDALTAEAERMNPVETGGVLMGIISPWGITVTHVIGPGPNAKHHAQHFEHDESFVLGQVGHAAMTWGLDYLGDWHTHPNGDGALSPQDMTMLRAKRTACPIVMVVARDDDGEPWESWPWRRRGERVDLMTVEVMSDTSQATPQVSPEVAPSA